ncbi:MAG TPA: recombinase family protein [Lysobacter sp.]|nr:recombinase family protein [Lysobacter sp.]
MAFVGNASGEPYRGYVGDASNCNRLCRPRRAATIANHLMLHILAAVAEHERSMISERTKAALRSARARGVKLGGPNIAEARIRSAVGRATNARRRPASVSSRV